MCFVMTLNLFRAFSFAVLTKIREEVDARRIYYVRGFEVCKTVLSNSNVFNTLFLALIGSQPISVIASQKIIKYLVFYFFFVSLNANDTTARRKVARISLPF